MDLCVLGAISFSVKHRQDDDSQEDSDQDRGRVPSFQKSLSELFHQINGEDSGKLMIKESFMITCQSFTFKWVNILHS